MKPCYLRQPDGDCALTLDTDMQQNSLSQGEQRCDQVQFLPAQSSSWLFWVAAMALVGEATPAVPLVREEGAAVDRTPVEPSPVEPSAQAGPELTAQVRRAVLRGPVEARLVEPKERLEPAETTSREELPAVPQQVAQVEARAERLRGEAERAVQMQLLEGEVVAVVVRREMAELRGQAVARGRLAIVFSRADTPLNPWQL
jgi:hypothetical protein